MKILTAEVIRPRNGTDIVYLQTDVISPFVGPDKLSLRFDVPRGGAVEFLRKYFPGVVLTRVVEDSGGDAQTMHRT